MKQIPNYPGYFADKEGNIYSVKHKISGKRNNYIFGEPKLLKVSIEGAGYPSLGLWNDGTPSRVRVHRLIAETFLENPDKKRYVCHKDGNKKNNSVENLYWGTSKDNHDDAVRHGTWWSTRRNPKSLPDLCHCHLPKHKVCESRYQECQHCRK